MSKYDPCIFCLSETWHIKSMKNTFLNNYEVIENFGKRGSNLGRFTLGYIVGVKLGIKYTLLYRDDFSCFLSCENKIIAFTYVPPAVEFVGNLISFLGKVKDFRTKLNTKSFIIMGDFNARIGRMQNLTSLNSQGLGSDRTSKDFKSNSRGNFLMSKLNELDFNIVNGNCLYDKNGEFTFINHMGASVIDLCAVSFNVRLKNFNFKVLEAPFTNHFPISIEFSNALVDKPVENKSVLKIKWDSKKRSEFCRILDSEMTSINISTIDQILNSIHKSADDCGMTKQCKLSGEKVKRGAPWFDVNCKDSKKNS